MSVSKSATRAPASSTRAGEGTFRTLEGSPKGGLPAPAAPAFAPDEDFLGTGVAGFAASADLLPPAVTDFAPPLRPLRLAKRIPDPHDRPTLLCSVLAILFHHCRHNSSNISSVRENPQATSHTRRRHVFALRPGDRNILRPSTPGNLQHSRRRLPELGRRHPSRGGRTCPHQLHSKTIRDPQSPHCSTYFSLFSSRGSLLRRPFLGHVHRFLPAAVDSVIPGIATVWQAVQFEDPIQPNIGPPDILAP
jgi:hypothetical protein